MTFAFTRRFGGIVDALHVNVRIRRPAGLTEPAGEFYSVRALWDTGATSSSISKSVVEQLGLKKSGETMSYSAHGIRKVDTYVVDVKLPNIPVFPCFKVSECFIPGAEMVIGMDIITMGEFAVTTNGGNTVLTFQRPSTHTHDYEKEAGLR